MLGNYYITNMLAGQKGEGMMFRDTTEAITAHQMGKVHVHAKVKVRLPDGQKGHGRPRARKRAA